MKKKKQNPLNDDRCQKCVLPSNFPGIKFNNDGICQYCLAMDQKGDVAHIQKEVENFIKGNLGKSKNYDIVLAFSGGKDSTFTLKYLKENFNARIIAITVDNDFMSPRAYENCKNVTTAFEVDHIFFKPNPKAMREIFRTSISENLYPTAALMRASSICNSCIQIINTHILNFASHYGVSMVAGGYIGGQVPSTGLMKQNLNVAASIRKPFMDKLRPFLSVDSLRLFQLESGPVKEIAVINPLLYLNRTEEEIIEEISGPGWTEPTDTGQFSTNCLLNDFAIFSHEKIHHFHPYIFEISAMVREGRLDRNKALQKIAVKFREEDFNNYLRV